MIATLPIKPPLPEMEPANHHHRRRRLPFHQDLRPVAATAARPAAPTVAAATQAQVEAATPILFLHFITTVIDMQAPFLTANLLPINHPSNFLKMRWHHPLISMVDILGYGSCWWAPKALSCEPKLLHVGLKPHPLSLG